MIFAVAAGLGAVSRFVLRSVVNSPTGTMLANVIGAAMLGWLVAGPWTDHELWVVGTGFLGSFTTFSTWMWESKENPAPIFVTLVAGLIGAWIGSLAA